MQRLAASLVVLRHHSSLIIPAPPSCLSKSHTFPKLTPFRSLSCLALPSITTFSTFSSLPYDVHNVYMSEMTSSKESTSQFQLQLPSVVSKGDDNCVIFAITAANTFVYLLWKVAPSSFMMRHFCSSISSIRYARVYTSFTSTFSHLGFMHLFVNMFGLYHFGFDVAEVLGPERFFLFYTGAGITSSLISLAYRHLTRSHTTASLGASGAIIATMWLNACFFPDRRLSFLFTERTATMQEFVIFCSVLDAAGMLGRFHRIDFAAHLGGALFANMWFGAVRHQLAEECATNSGGKSVSLLSRFRSIIHRNEKCHCLCHEQDRVQAAEVDVSIDLDS